MYTVKIWARTASAAFEAALSAGHNALSVRRVRHGYAVTCRGNASVACVVMLLPAAGLFVLLASIVGVAS